MKWFLWHGNSFSALEGLEGGAWDLEGGVASSATVAKRGKEVQEFTDYIQANRAFLVNYGDTVAKTDSACAKPQDLRVFRPH